MGATNGPAEEHPSAPVRGAGPASLEFDESALGARDYVGSIVVTLEAIAKYCDAIGERNPLYADDEAARAGPHGGIVAPPMFLLRPRLERGRDPRVRIDGVLMPPDHVDLFGGQRLELRLPVRPGDTLRAYAQVKAVFEKTGRSGSMVFVVRRVDYLNQHEQDIASFEYAIIQRRGALWK